MITALADAQAYIDALLARSFRPATANKTRSFA